MTSKPPFGGEVVRLGDVCRVVHGKNQKAVANPEGRYPIYGSGGVMGRADDFICPANTVVIGRKGTINKPIYVREPFWNVDTAFGLVANQTELLPRYLFHFCVHFNFENLSTTSAIPSLTSKNIERIQISLPSIDMQKSQVTRLDSCMKQSELCDGFVAKLDSLVKSRFVEMFGDPTGEDSGWQKRRLDSFSTIVTGNTPSRRKPEYYGDYIEWIKTDNITAATTLTRAAEGLSEAGARAGRTAPSGSVLMACIAGSVKSIGKVAIADRDVAFNQQINAIVPGGDVLTEYLYWMLSLSKGYLCSDINMQLKGILNKTTLSKKEFPLPPLALQREFADFASRVGKLRVDAQAQKEKLQTLYDSLAQDYFAI